MRVKESILLLIENLMNGRRFCVAFGTRKRCCRSISVAYDVYHLNHIKTALELESRSDERLLMMLSCCCACQERPNAAVARLQTGAWTVSQ